MLVCMWGEEGCGASVHVGRRDVVLVCMWGEEGCGASVNVGRRDVVLVCMWGGGMWC